MGAYVQTTQWERTRSTCLAIRRNTSRRRCKRPMACSSSSHRICTNSTCMACSSRSQACICLGRRPTFDRRGFSGMHHHMHERQSLWQRVLGTGAQAEMRCAFRCCSTGADARPHSACADADPARRETVLACACFAHDRGQLWSSCGTRACFCPLAAPLSNLCALHRCTSCHSACITAPRKDCLVDCRPSAQIRAPRDSAHRLAWQAL